MFLNKDGDEDWQESPAKILRRIAIVLVVVFILIILSATPFHLGKFDQIRPYFLLIAVYYWAVIRPTTLPPLPTFITGIILDLLTGYPLGMNALTLVAAQWVTRTQRRFLAGQPFMVIWAGFALEALLAGILQWTVFSLFNTSLMSIASPLISVLMTAVLFPLVVLPLAAANKMLEDHPSSI